jgi:hypothetical protein
MISTEVVLATSARIGAGQLRLDWCDRLIFEKFERQTDQFPAKYGSRRAARTPDLFAEVK